MPWYVVGLVGLMALLGCGTEAPPAAQEACVAQLEAWLSDPVCREALGDTAQAQGLATQLLEGLTEKPTVRPGRRDFPTLQWKEQ